MKWLVRFIAFLSVLLLVGCSTAVGGDAEWRGNFASSVLGDVRTVDPCGYLGVADLNRIGRIDQHRLASFDDCLVRLDVPGGVGIVGFWIGELTVGEAVPGLPPRGYGGFDLLVANDPCAGSSYLRFSDGVLLGIRGNEGSLKGV